jgi:hypothetical protein
MTDTTEQPTARAQLAARTRAARALRVRTSRLERARAEWTTAILAAHAAGASLRAIAADAGVSYQTIYNLTREAADGQ